MTSVHLTRRAVGWQRAACVALTALTTHAAAQQPGATDTLLTLQGFTQNAGQWPAACAFADVLGPVTLSVESSELTFMTRGRSVRGCRVRIGELGPWSGADRLSGTRNFFVGRDPARWRAGVAAYAGLVARDATGSFVSVNRHPSGVSLSVQASGQRALPSVEVEVIGDAQLEVRAGGELAIDVDIGVLALRHPMASTTVPTSSGASVWSVSPDQRVARLSLTQLDGAQPSVADLAIEWSSFLGGTDAEHPEAVCFPGPKGSVTVTGETWSPDFPVTAQVFDPTYDPGGVNVDDIFVCRFGADGSSLEFATYLGGSNSDLVRSADVSPNGEITIVGWTGSSTFPTTPGACFETKADAFHPDAFVTRMAADGSALVWSTFVGGTLADVVTSGELLPDGSVLVAGITDSIDYPHTIGNVRSGLGNNGFVTRVSSDGASLVFSRYIGGSANDSVNSLAWHPTGQVGIAGGTQSLDFPYTAGAWSHAALGAYVALLDDTSGQLQAVSAFGGSNGDGMDAAAFDTFGNLYIAGQSLSTDLPTTGESFQPHIAPSLQSQDGYIACFDSTLSSVLHCTYLGGNLQDWIDSLHVDSAGLVTVAGVTNSAFFPVTPGAFTTTLHGGQGQYDAFVARLDRNLSKLHYSTFIGGMGTENLGSGGGKNVADVAPDGRVAMAIGTASTDFPVTPGAFSTTLAGPTDAAVLVMNLLPLGIEKVGTSTPGFNGPLVMGVTAMPKVGSKIFALNCTGAPPKSTRGFLALSLATAPAALPVGGIDLWLDPALLIAVAPVTSDEYGHVEVPLRIPPDPSLAGLQVAGQFAWSDDASPGGKFSASNALAVTVQP